MNVFSDYALFYDLFYKDKDYLSEAEYVTKLIRQYAPKTKKLLDMGCGSGRGSIILARKGFDVFGVDLSGRMIEQAFCSKESVENNSIGDLRFSVADIRDLHLAEKFDVAVSLFHVMSYQAGNEDIKAAIKNAAEHLTPGGVFVFDFWYGPAVLTDLPGVRKRKVSDGSLEIRRTATPTMLVNENCVQVDYDFLVTDTAANRTTQFSERHIMRYFFLPEMLEFLALGGFEPLFAYKWLTFEQPSRQSWYVCCGAKLKGAL